MVGRIADRLAIHPDEKLRLLEAANFKRKKSSGEGRCLKYASIPEDIFEVIADWQHFAILNWRVVRLAMRCGLASS